MARDLHALTRRLGTAEVAHRIGLSPYALRNRRCGSVALTVDDLDALAREFGDGFDMAGTVKRIAATRRQKQEQP